MVYIAALTLDSGDEMHSLKRAQIAYLKADEACVKVPSNCADFAGVFFIQVGCRTSQTCED